MWQHQVNRASIDAMHARMRRREETSAAIALTKTAQDIKAAEAAEIDAKVDRPKPFTRQAYGVDPASRTRLTARVFMRPLQARYLQYQIEGGPRSRKAFELKLGGRVYQALIVPGEDQPLDQFGNISRADIIRITRELNAPDARKRYFIGVPRNNPGMPAGVYRRSPDRSGLELLMVLIDGANYSPLIQWRQVARETFARQWPARIAEARAGIR